MTGARPVATIPVGLLSGGTGLLAVAEVQVVRRPVETAGHVYLGHGRPSLAHPDLTYPSRRADRVRGREPRRVTTLVKLLMGLYRPTGGRILVDGIDLRELAPAGWCRRFRAVLQQCLRYQASVRENVAFEQATGSDDEPAAALESAAVAAARTVILVSHRLGCRRLADRIPVLQGGRPAEQGSHAEPVSAGGPHAELYRLQAAWYPGMSADASGAPVASRRANRGDAKRYVRVAWRAKRGCTI